MILASLIDISPIGFSLISFSVDDVSARLGLVVGSCVLLVILLCDVDAQHTGRPNKDAQHTERSESGALSDTLMPSASVYE